MIDEITPIQCIILTLSVEIPILSSRGTYVFSIIVIIVDRMEFPALGVVYQKMYAKDICQVFVFTSASSFVKSSIVPVISAVLPNARL